MNFKIKYPKKGKILIITSMLIIIIFTFFNVYCNSCDENRNKSNKVLIIAHKGASAFEPENTIASFKRAFEMKADIIEMDIHQTKDSVIVVMHDKDISRTTNGKGLIKDYFINDLMKFDAGFWFNVKNKYERIPTLEEVFKFDSGKVKLLIEIKYGNDYYPGIEKNLINLIKKYNAYCWCIVQSFKDDPLITIHAIDTNIVLEKLIVGDIPILPVYIDNGLNFGSIFDLKFIKSINVNKIFLTKNLINEIHKKGFKVKVWTVDEKKVALDFINYGVDGVITNNPNILQR